MTPTTEQVPIDFANHPDPVDNPLPPLAPVPVTHVIGLSGGKDSTAMALRLKELEPDTDWTYLITPTGDELPELLDHWAHLETLLGKPMVRITNGSLNSLISGFNALPNNNQRWCTRLLKIVPCEAWIARHRPAILYVGLRADEEERQGLYSKRVRVRFPMREWGWGLREVRSYLKDRGVTIPRRTDCARCYDQRIIEWKRLWQEHPDLWAEAEAQEAATGHTFRSPTRDTWPAALKDMRAEFERGRPVRGEGRDEAEGAACRVCRL